MLQDHARIMCMILEHFKIEHFYVWWYWINVWWTEFYSRGAPSKKFENHWYTRDPWRDAMHWPWNPRARVPRPSSTSWAPPPPLSPIICAAPATSHPTAGASLTLNNWRTQSTLDQSAVLTELVLVIPWDRPGSNLFISNQTSWPTISE